MRQKRIFERITSVALAAALSFTSIVPAFASEADAGSYEESIPAAQESVEAPAESTTEAIRNEAEEASYGSNEEMSEGYEEDNQDDYNPYIMLLPHMDGVSYSYDEAHRDANYSTGEYTVLLYEAGEAVNFGINSEMKFSIVNASSLDTFMTWENFENGNISFTMPQADLSVQFIIPSEEKEEAAQEEEDEPEIKQEDAEPAASESLNNEIKAEPEVKEEETQEIPEETAQEEIGTEASEESSDEIHEEEIPGKETEISVDEQDAVPEEQENVTEEAEIIGKETEISEEIPETVEEESSESLEDEEIESELESEAEEEAEKETYRVYAADSEYFSVEFKDGKQEYYPGETVNVVISPVENAVVGDVNILSILDTQEELEDVEEVSESMILVSSDIAPNSVETIDPESVITEDENGVYIELPEGIGEAKEIEFEMPEEDVAVTAAVRVLDVLQAISKVNLNNHSGNAVGPASLKKSGTYLSIQEMEVKITTADGKNVNLTYKNNVNAGTATVVVTGRYDYYNYSGSATFKINKFSKTFNVTLSGSSFKYTGSAIKPKVTVKHDGKSVSSKYYTVKYASNKNTGIATVTVTGKSTYNGVTGKATFNIVPKQHSITSAKSGKKGEVQVKWKKDSQASGYEIQYSQNSNMKKILKTQNISKNGTLTYTFKKLISKKTYYFRIRAYKSSGGKKLYGAWSKTKKVRVK